MRTKLPLLVRLALAAACTWCAIAAGARPAWAQCDCASATVLECAKTPTHLLFELRDEELIAAAPCVVQCGEFTPAERRDALIALATAELRRGNETAARTACADAWKIDPCGEVGDPFPEPIREMFYATQIRQQLELELPPCPGDLRTMAVGEIECSCFGDEMVSFTRGIRAVIMSHLAGATCLRLVDRARLDVLLKELQLPVKDGWRKAGLLGAQSFLFVDIVQIPGRDKFKMVARLVRTEQTDVLLGRGTSKERPARDLFRMEEELVLDGIAPAINALCEDMLPEDQRKRIERYYEAIEGMSREYPAYVTAVSAAEDAERRADWEAAEREWAKAETLNPRDERATARKRIAAGFSKQSTAR